MRWVAVREHYPSGNSVTITVTVTVTSLPVSLPPKEL